MMRRTDARVWREARTFEELAQLTSNWLDGALRSHPNGHHGGPDFETRPIAGVLSEANRGGFLTEGSQPGELAAFRGDPWHQRAYVCGFACPGLAQVLGEVARQAELVPRIYLPSGRCLRHGGAVDVTRWGARIALGVGDFYKARAIRQIYLGCRAQAVNEVIAACQVTLIDPEWGRNDLLWGTLHQALATRQEHERGVQL